MGLGLCAVRNSRSASAECTYCSATKMAWRNASHVFSAQRIAPSNCIYIEAAENTAENRVSGAERYAKVYNIDYNRCIFCGYCVEACPTDAITHGHGFEVATFNATNLVYRKEQMLAAMPAHMGSNAVFNQSEQCGEKKY